MDSIWSVPPMPNIISFKPSYLINDLSILLHFSFTVDTRLPTRVIRIQWQTRNPKQFCSCQKLFIRKVILEKNNILISFSLTRYLCTSVVLLSSNPRSVCCWPIHAASYPNAASITDCSRVENTASSSLNLPADIPQKYIF